MAARRPDRDATRTLPFHLHPRRRPATLEPLPSPDALVPAALDTSRAAAPLRLEARHPYRGALGVALLLAASAALAWGATAEALDAATRGLDWLRAHDTARGRALVAVLSVAVAALVLLAAWGRETAERRPVRLAGGRARMTVDEVAAALRDAVLDTAALADAAVRVQNLHGRGLRVTVRAEVRPQARIDQTVDAVDAAVREAVQRRLGVRLAARPAVDVRYQELDLRWGRD